MTLPTEKIANNQMESVSNFNDYKFQQQSQRDNFSEIRTLTNEDHRQ